MAEASLQELRQMLSQYEANPTESDAPEDETTDAESVQEEVTRAYRKILRLASVREHSTQSIRNRLERDGYAENVIEAALEKAYHVRAIDDRRYAEAFVRTKRAAGKGMAGIEKELGKLGIDPESLEAWQDAQEGESELERALALLDAKPPHSKNLREGAFRKLIGQGFDPSTASRAARQWVEQQPQ